MMPAGLPSWEQIHLFTVTTVAEPSATPQINWTIHTNLLLGSPKQHETSSPCSLISLFWIPFPRISIWTNPTHALRLNSNSILPAGAWHHVSLLPTNSSILAHMWLLTRHSSPHLSSPEIHWRHWEGRGLRWLLYHRGSLTGEKAADSSPGHASD